MKVAIFSRYPSDSGHPKGGVESVTVVLVKALAQLDDLDIHVVTLEQERSRIAIEHDKDVTVHRLSGSGWPQVLDILAGPGKRRLLSYIRDLEPDVLHIHESYGLGLGSFSIPHVFTVHGFDHANLIAQSAKFGWIRSKLWKFVEQRGLAAQKHIISITPYVREMIEPLTSASIYDIRNPVDEGFFKIARCPEPGRILYAAWIDENKNTLGAVKAFAGVATDCPEARLIIAGEPRDAEYIVRVKHSIEYYGISDKVEILGFLGRTELGKELTRASVFLLPSRQDTAPMAIAEAMAAGLPVIASNRSGIPYMLVEGQTGFLIDPESTDQMTERLTQLVRSQQLCRQMGQAGHKVAMERFHPHVVAQKTRDVYMRICKDA